MCNDFIAERESYRVVLHPRKPLGDKARQGASTSKCIWVNSSLFPRRCTTHAKLKEFYEDMYNKM
eukprot:4625950-Pleurochrysis_carterae.AAC.1